MSMDSAQMKRILNNADQDKRSGSFSITNKKHAGEGGYLSVSMTAQDKRKRARGGSIA